MNIELSKIKPQYMSEDEILGSDIYLQDKIVFEKGKKYLIKANSGNGKTSLLNFIYGSYINFDGSINFVTPIKKYTVDNLHKTILSYVFQDLKMFSSLTVFENIQIKNTLTNYKSKEEIYSLIDQVKLFNKKNSLLRTLSLGQKQRVAIIRALCQPFKFLLLDEPTSHLDMDNIKIITNIIHQETEEQNACLILTSLTNERLFDFDKVLNL